MSGQKSAEECSSRKKTVESQFMIQQNFMPNLVLFLASADSSYSIGSELVI
ncbi:hypothetical protein ACFW1P_18905 [Paenibacillus sp. NPDC058910]|uniref:hypothetical protein n=1 Tax=unclassified Paenibacillus TaxID=185978 RepID=UPI0036C4F7A8